MSEQSPFLERSLNAARVKYLGMLFVAILSLKDYTNRQNTASSASQLPATTRLNTVSDITKNHISFVGSEPKQTLPITAQKEDTPNNTAEMQLPRELSEHLLLIIDQELEKQHRGERTDGYDALRRVLISEYGSDAAFEAEIGASIDSVARSYTKSYFEPYIIPGSAELDSYYGAHKDSMDQVLKTPVHFSLDSTYTIPGVYSIDVDMSGNPEAGDGTFLITFYMVETDTITDTERIDDTSDETITITRHPHKVKTYKNFDGLQEIESNFPEGGRGLCERIFGVMIEDYKKRLEEQVWHMLWENKSVEARIDFDQYKAPTAVIDYVQGLAEQKLAGSYNGDGYDAVRDFLLKFYNAKQYDNAAITPQVKYTFLQKTKGFEYSRLVDHLLSKYAGGVFKNE